MNVKKSQNGNLIEIKVLELNFFLNFSVINLIFYSNLKIKLKKIFLWNLLARIKKGFATTNNPGETWHLNINVDCEKVKNN